MTLFPSDDPNHLAHAIATANRRNQRILLMPGQYLTKPGRGHQIPLNANGIKMTGSLLPLFSTTIKRPDHGINPASTDNNFGVYFVPSKPTEAEWASIREWKLHQVTNPQTGVTTRFEYAVLVRGKIVVENIELDCNMGRQGLPADIPSHKIEHSAMLAFAGKKYQHPGDARYQNKFIFTAFESVTLKNIRTTRGGYADDIWISRGYGRPNIGKVTIRKIHSENRVNNKRSTITFSGLAQRVGIAHATIDSLQAEETSSRWAELPGEPIDDTNRYSFWKLRNIVCETFDIAAKGKAIFLDAANITATSSTHLYQAGGMIRNASFTTLPHPTPLNRLNNLTFKNVSWKFQAFRNTKGNFIGISPQPQYGEPCSATFIENTFKVAGDLITDDETEFHSLIDTTYVPAAGNAVTLLFSKCSYDDRFGKEAKTFIAQAVGRGHYSFRIADFGGIPWERAIFIKPGITPVTIWGKLIIHIP